MDGDGAVTQSSYKWSNGETVPMSLWDPNTVQEAGCKAIFKYSNSSTGIWHDTSCGEELRKVVCAIILG